MSRFFAIAVALCAPALLSAAEDHARPSDGARGMCGAMGTVYFIPDDWEGPPVHPNPEGPTTWWKDSDGIDPGVAGCHLGQTPEGKPNKRMFGEACLNDKLLVESNPGAGVLHSHSNDVGHPDTFDCELWCKGQGARTGVCKPAPAPPCENSAKCVCSGRPKG